METKHCVDAIIIYEKNIGDSIASTKDYVLIERLTEPRGLALPGGKKEAFETNEEALVREVQEETGLFFTPSFWLPKRYDKPGRDPRWPSTSYVACGVGRGTLQEEQGKTRVLLLSQKELYVCLNTFAFDHGEILRDYFDLL